MKGTNEGTPQRFDHIIIDETKRTLTRPTTPPDTVLIDGYTILYRGKRPEFKPKALLNHVFLLPDSLYSLSGADRTYRRLTSLHVFDRIDITYDSALTHLPGHVDCRIGLIRSKRQSLSTEGFLTNRGGFLGTSINVGFRHKNLFHRMAQLQVALTLGFEAQQNLGGSSGSTSDASTEVGREAFFNTVSIGPDITLKFPKPLIDFGLQPWKGASSRKTSLAVLYNYQRRPDYTRTVSKVSLGQEYAWQRYTWAFDPISVNVIKIPFKSDAFNEYLLEANDPVLTDSYTDHMIVGQRFALTYNTQDGSGARDNWFARGVLDVAGNLLRPFGDLKVDPETGEEYFTVFGIRYAQFAKIDLDGRYYHKIHDKRSFVVRAAFGIGKPYGNLGLLPFESAFFAGGANGIRAWRARSLGPGSYSSPTNSFDRTGEMHIEGNFEYRFKLIGYLEGALFTDVGNIWMLQPTGTRPGGDFKWDRFLSEFAVGTGIGARFNFDFFIVRFDFGLQTKDPSLPVGQRWLFQKHDIPQTFGSLLNFNLGIGYPF